MNPIRFLCACECSGALRSELRKRGIDAYSCDILPAEDDQTHHLQCDVREVLDQQWDAVAAFPPCTHLAVSGAKHFAAKRADGRQQAAVEFFMLFAKLSVPYAIENPVGIMSSEWRKPDQIIQPWMFGDEATKTTCLWLNQLPPLSPTRIVDKGARHVTKSGKSLPSWYNLPPSENRAKIRSRTFPGIASAMAEQWSSYLTSLLTVTNPEQP